MEKSIVSIYRQHCNKGVSADTIYISTNKIIHIMYMMKDLIMEMKLLMKGNY